MPRTAQEEPCAENQDGAIYAVFVPAGWQTPLARDVKGGCGGGRIRNGRYAAGGLDQMAQTVMDRKPKTVAARKNVQPPLPIEGLTDAPTAAPESERTKLPPKAAAIAEKARNAEIPETLGATRVGSIAGTAKSVRLNPEFSRWLMGFPKEWGFCGVMAMRSCRKSQRRS